MNALATVPPPTNPAQLPSLPAWLKLRSDALAAADSLEFRTKQSLHESLILNSSEVAEVQQHIAELAVFTGLDRPALIRGQWLDQQQALTTIIAGLLIKSKRRLDKAASDVVTEDYFDALEDMPAWAVREALRKWNRAESAPTDPKHPHDFVWAPEPPVLRKLSEHELMRVKARILQLQRLCDAVAIVEYSDEHRKTMLGRLAAIFKDAGEKLTGQITDSAHG